MPVSSSPTFLTLISHGATAATRRSAFPADEEVEPGMLVKARQWNVLKSGRGQVLASPERRARETAIALGREAEPVEALHECRYGRWTGRTIEDVSKTEPENLALWLSDLAAAPHGGESLRQACGRMAGWMDALARGGTLFLVTHPTLIRAAFLHALGLPPASFWKIDIEPLSATHFVHAAGRWALRQRSSA